LKKGCKKLKLRLSNFIAISAALSALAFSLPDATAQPTQTSMAFSAADTMPEHMVVEAAEYPWSAVGRLNTGGRGFCTGVLVDEQHVLTDAHCLFYRTEGRWWKPNELHFVAGYQRDTNVSHSKVKGYELAPGYRAQGGVSLASIMNNWALVKLEKPLGRQTGWLGLKNLDKDLIQRLRDGQGALLQAGYRRNAQHAITVGFDCRPDGFFAAESRIGNRCQLKPGRADLPFLVYIDGSFSVVANRVLTSLARHTPRSGSLSDASFRAKMNRGESRAPKAGAGAALVPMDTIAHLLESLGYLEPGSGAAQAPVRSAAIRTFETSRGLPVTGQASVSLLGEIIEASH
jgi:protease YdgD